LVQQVNTARTTGWMESSDPSEPLKQALVKLCGKRIAHKVLRGVREPILIRDEFWDSLPEGSSEWMSNMLRLHRKFNAQPMVVVQSSEQLAA
jgi:DNA helicase HerA-like ATPase